MEAIKSSNLIVHSFERWQNTVKEAVAKKHARLDEEIDKLQSLVDKLKENQKDDKTERRRYARGIRFSVSVVDIFTQLELISQLYHQSSQIQKKEYIRSLSNYIASVLRRPELKGGFFYLQMEDEFSIRSLSGEDPTEIVYSAIMPMVDELI